MPRRRRGNYRRKGRSSAGYGYHIDQAAKLAALAFTVHKLKKLINVEYKLIPRVGATSPSTSTGSVQALTGVAQGDAAASRDGNKIRMFSMNLSGVATMSTAATSTSVAVAIIQDLSNQGANPAITDVWPTVADFATGTPRTAGSQLSSRFRILYYRVALLSDNGRQKAQFKKYIKKFPLSHVYYEGANATDESRGSIYLFTASSEATNTPVLAIDIESKFIDN